MKKSLLPLLFLFLFIFSAARVKAQPEPMEFQKLDNYSLNKDVRLAAGFNCVVFTNAPQFNKMFSQAKGAAPAVVPNFGMQRVAAIILPPTMRNTTLTIDKVEMSGPIAYIHFREVLAENLSTAITPFTIASFDRASFIKTIAFYKDKRLIKSVAVK